MIRFDEVAGDAESQRLFTDWSVGSWISNLRKGVSSFVVVAEADNGNESGFAGSFLWRSGLFSSLQSRLSEESITVDTAPNLSSFLIQNGTIPILCRVETLASISSPPLVCP